MACIRPMIKTTRCGDRRVQNAGDVDAWPLFEALNGLPTALIHGANSGLFVTETALEMKRRVPNAPDPCSRSRAYSVSR